MLPHYKEAVNTYYQNVFREVVYKLLFEMMKSKFRSSAYLELEEILQFVVHFHVESAEMYEINYFLLQTIYVDIDENFAIFSFNLNDNSTQMHHFG